MRRLRSSWRLPTALALGGILWAGTPQETRPVEAEPYVVWRASQPLFEHPITFSRRLAILPQGTKVAPLEPEAEGRPAPRPWGRVAVTLGPEEEPQEHTGWLLMTPRQRRAGELAPELGGAAAPTGLALAAKALVDGLEALLKDAKRSFPTVEEALQALEEAWLEPEEVAAFAREGNLKVPGREAR